jgi:ectoine hydroxylase-related dioxygenase (phytanoyl-CoA dioxygenase family)
MAGGMRTTRKPELPAPTPLRVSDPGVGSHVIRRHAEREGYVFCRGLVPRDRIDALRAHALAVAENLGWLDPDAPPGAALAIAGVRLGAYDDPRWIEFLEIVLPHSTFTAVRTAPPVVALLTAILGAPPQPDAGDLCRVVSSDDPTHTTVAHQDRFYLPDGAPRWSMWVPLGPCPLALGPLAVLPRSHARGLLPHAGETAWRRGVDVADDADWAASHLEPGDAIFFGWLTVHRALPNVGGRALRLSATYRYRAASLG